MPCGLGRGEGEIEKRRSRERDLDPKSTSAGSVDMKLRTTVLNWDSFTLLINTAIQAPSSQNYDILLCILSSSSGS